MSWFQHKHNLVIDAGNTNVTFALARGMDIVHEYRRETNAHATADDLAVWFLPLLQLDKKDFSAISRVVIASVVPGLDYALRTFCRKYLQCEPLFIGADTALPFQILLPQPHQAGADRLANAAAVRMFYPTPAVVVDIGTATTFDWVDAGGNYAGGVIAPGPKASLDALTAATAKLPNVRMTKPSGVLGTDTAAAMQSGFFWGYVGLINEILSQLQREQGAAQSIIVTGGLAKLFQDHIVGLTAADMDITIKGALVIAQSVQKQAA